MKVRSFALQIRSMCLACGLVSLLAASSCGVEEDELLGPQVPVNPYVQTIAYGAYAGLGGLVLSGASGTPRQIIGADDSIVSSQWSPDKRSIAYVRLNGFLPGHHVKLAHTDGRGVITLAEGVRGANLAPGCWSPDGQSLVFEGGPNNLIVVSATTGALEFFVPGAVGASFMTDSTLVCQLIQDSNLDSTIIVEVNTTSGAMRGLAFDTGGSYFLPRVHRTSNKFAYVFAPSGDHDKTNEIWVMNADGTGKQRMARGGAEYIQGRVREMRFSPDGSRLVFVPDWGALTRLHVIHLGTGDVRELPDATALPWARCDWSPASDRIVFSHRHGGICVINHDGTGVMRLDSLGEDPTW
jgi:Tol biopolymer transport system component